jgi:aspartyl-tRNA(Asn)/glutamyl-tRNA(Gln) amidotransferase subunit A
MDTTELCFTPATELTRLIRARQLSPVELMDAVIGRAEALNPKLNAICTPTYDTAREAAKAAEAALSRNEAMGPLHGIPVTIKDLVFTKGVRTMAGSHVFKDRVPDFDAPIVERFRDAGAISIGKTTVPEFGWIGCGDSPLTGTTHNPWKHGYNAGGSSSGAGVCAAAGIAPLHQGSDGAGSIRMPSGFCGIYGLKPSFARIPYYPTPANDLISHIGPMTRTVGDSALMLEVLAGPDDRDISSLEGRPEPYLARLDEGIRGLKVAYSPDLGYLKVDPEVAELVRGAVPAFEEQGAHVEEVDPGWGDPIEMEHCFWTTNYAGLYGPYLAKFRDKMDPGVIACIEHGLRYSAAELVAFRARRLEYYDKVRRFFETYDLLLTPTLSVAAFPTGRIIPEHWEQHSWDWIRWAGFSYPFNLTWVPAATCPCGFTKEGLPVGIQIVGPRHRDLLVLQASRAFEQARPWADKRPPV